MLILHTKETVLVELTQACMVRIAKALHIEPSQVDITWENGKEGLKPRVDISLPPILPPSDLDVTNQAAFAAWQEEHANDLPGIHEFLKAKGTDNPEQVIAHYVTVMATEAKLRFAEF